MRGKVAIAVIRKVTAKRIMALSLYLRSKETAPKIISISIIPRLRYSFPSLKRMTKGPAMFFITGIE